jgi:hypothetical protein
VTRVMTCDPICIGRRPGHSGVGPTWVSRQALPAQRGDPRHPRSLSCKSLVPGPRAILCHSDKEHGVLGLLLGDHGAADGHDGGDDAVDALGGLVLGRLEVAGGILGDRDRRCDPTRQTKCSEYSGWGSSWATMARPMAMMVATMPSMRSVDLSLAGLRLPAGSWATARSETVS